MNLTSLIWAGIWPHWKLKFKGKKKGHRGGVGAGARERGQEMKHILPCWWEVFPLSRAVHFWGPDTFFTLRCEAGLEVSLACLCAFTNVLAAQQIQYGNLLGKQKRRVYFRVYLTEGQSIESKKNCEKGDSMFWAFKEYVCVCASMREYNTRHTLIQTNWEWSHRDPAVQEAVVSP